MYTYLEIFTSLSLFIYIYIHICILLSSGGQRSRRVLEVTPQGLLVFCFSKNILGFGGAAWHTINLCVAPSMSGHCAAYPEPLALGWANTKRPNQNKLYV